MIVLTIKMLKSSNVKLRFQPLLPLFDPVAPGRNDLLLPPNTITTYLTATSIQRSFLFILPLPFLSLSMFCLAASSHFHAAESPCRLIPSGATRLSRSSALPNASADRDRWRPFKRSHGSVLFLVLTTPAQTRRHARKRTLCTDGVGPAGVRTQT